MRHFQHKVSSVVCVYLLINDWHLNWWTICFILIALQIDLLTWFWETRRPSDLVLHRRPGSVATALRSRKDLSVYMCLRSLLDAVLAISPFRWLNLSLVFWEKKTARRIMTVHLCCCYSAPTPRTFYLAWEVSNKAPTNSSPVYAKIRIHQPAIADQFPRFYKLHSRTNFLCKMWEDLQGGGHWHLRRGEHRPLETSAIDNTNSDLPYSQSIPPRGLTPCFKTFLCAFHIHSLFPASTNNRTMNPTPPIRHRDPPLWTRPPFRYPSPRPGALFGVLSVLRSNC